MTDKFHDKAKDAGNKLKAYILSISSGATGVFFFALTAILCLIELHLDAKRFFNIASQLEKPKQEQNWTYNENIKTIRLVAIYASYFSIFTAFILTFIYMLNRLA